jgi:hypothetical protein
MTNLESIFFEIIPTGKYHVQIVSSEMCETKSGNGRCLGLEIATVEVRQAGPDENGVMRETANKIGRYQPMNDYTSQQIAVTIQ